MRSYRFLPFLFLLFGSVTLAADFSPGEVNPLVATAADPDQSYAAYLPKAYSLEQDWPVLLIMDPRGRALEALEIFREGAERFGYIVVSSHGTRSDAAGDPNGAALRAILPELGQQFSIDPERLYLAGFSGTARSAWAFADSLKDHLAGVIGFGASTPPGFSGPYVAPFFGGAGELDFNYDEVWTLDGTLDEVGLPHEMRYYGGGHAWPPPSVAAEALGWMEIQGMRDGHREPDPDLAATLLAEGERRVDAEPDPYLQGVMLRSLARDFDGVVDVTAVAARAASLDGSAEYAKAAKRHAQIVERQMLFVGEHQNFLGRFLTWEQPPQLTWCYQELDIRGLQRRAKGTKDVADAQAAQRSLNLVFVYAYHYQPEEYLKRGDAPRAVAALNLANALVKGDPRVCLGMARAQAALGKEKESLKQLSCAAEGGILDRRTIAEQPYLEILHDNPEYQALVQSLPDPEAG